MAAAMDLARRQIEDGSATSQVITHFLKLASSREALEQQKLKQDMDLTQAKIEAMAAAHRVEELYDAAIKAMREYQGQDVDDLEIL
jgi:secreted PhoX family phosphatase